MTLAALLLALASLAPGEARLALDPTSAVIGQPVTVELSVRHAADERPALDPERLVPDDTWIVLAPPAVARRSLGADSGVESRFTLTVASLESGARSLPPPALLGLSDAPEVAPADLEVAAELAEGEDAPRPLAGFRPAPAGVEPLSPWPLLLGLAVLAALLVLAAVLRRRRRRPAPVPAAPAPVVRLARAFEAALATDDPAAVRAAHYELSRLLREVFDDRLGGERAAMCAGLADDEWLARLDGQPRLPAGARDELARLFDDAALVKYAGELPSRFAVAETRERAERVLRALAETPADQEAAA